MWHIIGYSVGLGQAIIWAIREARLHNAAQPSMIFNIKLDGWPFAGIVLITFSSTSLVNHNYFVYQSQTTTTTTTLSFKHLF